MYDIIVVEWTAGLRLQMNSYVKVNIDLLSLW